MCYLIAEVLDEDPRTVLRLNGHLAEEDGPVKPEVAGLVVKLQRVDLDDDRLVTLEAILDCWHRLDLRRRPSGSPSAA